MFSKVSRIGLWVSTIITLLIAALQGLSGNWITFFLFLPGAPNYGQTFLAAMVKLSSYHRAAGFAICGLAVITLLFAFNSKQNLLVRIFAVVGLVLTILAAVGGILYVASETADRMSLGQMADSFIGVFAAYFIQMIFMIKTPKFHWRSRAVKPAA